MYEKQAVDAGPRSPMYERASWTSPRRHDNDLRKEGLDVPQGNLELSTSVTTRGAAAVTTIRRLLEPLRRRPVRRLLVGGLVSKTGDWLTVGALMGWVYQETASTGSVALLMLVRLAPPILGGGAAAAFVDRVPRERLLVVVELLRADRARHRRRGPAQRHDGPRLCGDRRQRPARRDLAGRRLGAHPAPRARGATARRQRPERRDGEHGDGDRRDRRRPAARPRRRGPGARRRPLHLPAGGSAVRRHLRPRRAPARPPRRTSPTTRRSRGCATCSRIARSPPRSAPCASPSSPAAS